MILAGDQVFVIFIISRMAVTKPKPLYSVGIGDLTKSNHSVMMLRMRGIFLHCNYDVVLRYSDRRRSIF